MRPGPLVRWLALKKIFINYIPPASMVLDIGCGKGEITCRLAEVRDDITLVASDIDRAALETIDRKNLKAVESSAEKLPLSDSSFDVVLCLELLEHVEDDEAVISEISRVLKTGGVVIFSTPMEKGITLPFAKKENMERLLRSWGHIRPGYSFDKINQLFKKYHIEIKYRSRFFNVFSRFGYWLNTLSGMSVPYKEQICKLIMYLEPYIKFKSQEHIIVGKKCVIPNT